MNMILMYEVYVILSASLFCRYGYRTHHYIVNNRRRSHYRYHCHVDDEQKKKVRGFFIRPLQIFRFRWQTLT